MKKKVLLIGWDGADWRLADPLIKKGKMPQLCRMLDEGAHAKLRSLPPYLSPMLWNTISTGKRPFRHGIHGFTEVDSQTAKVRPVTSLSRRCKALWNILSQEGIPSYCVSWFASHPAEAVNGVIVSEQFTRPPSKTGEQWTIPKGAVYPSASAEGLAELRVHPDDIDPRILDFLVPKWRTIDAENERLLNLLLIRLAELYTTHNIASALASELDHGFLGVYFHFLDWICHDFMIYTTPQRKEVSDRDFELYQNVVNNAYRLQDILLSDLLKSSGPQTTALVLSDHGFQSGENRLQKTPSVTAGIAAWHRPYGILAMAGPGIRRNKEFYGASLLDITPTVLSLFNLPKGKDMDGRVLLESLVHDKLLEPIESWENKEGPYHYTSETVTIDESESDALLKQFADLGYIDSSDGEDPELLTIRENAWNLGVDLMSAGRFEEALPSLEEAYFHQPEQAYIAIQLGRCQIALGLFDEAQNTAQTIIDAGPDNATAHFLLGRLEMERNSIEKAKQFFINAYAINPELKGLKERLGYVALELNLIEDAESFYWAAKEEDEDNASVWLGLARIETLRGHWDQASEYARRALELRNDLAWGFAILGQCAAIKGCKDEALNFHQQAIRCNPGFLRSFRGILRNAGFDDNGIEVMREAVDRVRPHIDENTELCSAQILRIKKQAQARMEQRHSLQVKRRSCQQPMTQVKLPPRPGSSGKTFYIVSGLPRSGTSLMMKMLIKGGMEAMTDKIRPADENNQEGYYEWEPIKQLRQDPNIIEQTEGKVTKVVSLLLEALPAQHSYKMIFMKRPAPAIADSQATMLIKLGKEGAGYDRNQAIEQFQKHADKTLQRIRNHPSVTLLEIDFPNMFSNPDSVIDSLSEFLGSKILPTKENMKAAINPDLYHQKANE